MPVAPAIAAPRRGATAPALLPATEPDRRSPRARRRGPLVIIGALIALVVVVSGVVVAGGAVLSEMGSDSASSADIPAAERSEWSSIPSPSSQPPSVTNPDCPTATIGAVTWGRDAGGTSDGVAAIKAFDYSYYVLRSGAKAREFVAADAALIADSATMQRAIDALPAGTTHCLQITDRGNGLYEVTLAEFRPGAAPSLTFQVIQTGMREGRTVITAIPTNVSIGE